MRNESCPHGEAISTWRGDVPELAQPLGDEGGVLAAEAPVGVERHEQDVGRRRAGDGLRERLEVVHRAREVQVGERVEALEEARALVVEVVLDLEVRRQGHRPGLAARAVELAPHPLLGEVRDVGHHPRDGEAVRRAVGVRRIAQDRRAPDGGEADVLRAEARAGADHRRALDLLRGVERPLQRLHPAQRAADRGVQALDAEVAQQRAVDRVEVADRDEGEVQPVRLARRGIGRRRSGGALAAAEQVGADDEEAVGVDRPAGPDERAPPVGRVGVAGRARGRSAPHCLRRRRACRRSRRRRRRARASRRTPARAGRRRRTAGPSWSAPAPSRRDDAGVEARQVQPAREARVLDLQAAVRHDLQPGVMRDAHRLVAVQPELQPQRAGPRRDRLLGDARQLGLRGGRRRRCPARRAGPPATRRSACRGSRRSRGVTGQTS